MEGVFHARIVVFSSSHEWFANPSPLNPPPPPSHFPNLQARVHKVCADRFPKYAKGYNINRKRHPIHSFELMFEDEISSNVAAVDVTSALEVFNLGSADSYMVNALSRISR